MSNKDQVQRFIFEEFDVRGQLVGLKKSYQAAIEHHHYPEPLSKLIGEFLAAAALLSTTVKIKGTVSIQAQGDGDLSLIMAECHYNQELRAIARWEGEHCKENLRELLGVGQLVITIDPDEGQRYQGIVPLEGSSLSECLEAYFEKSEQLQTRVWLNTEPGIFASGLFIQALPKSRNNPIFSCEDTDTWNRICKLSDTLTLEELKELDNETILYRLFHNEAVRVFPSKPISFKCGCDRDRTIKALLSLGQEEVEDMFNEQPELSVKCEFCNKEYDFIFDDLAPYLMEQEILGVAEDLDPSRTLH